LRPREVGHVDPCARKSVEQACTDGLGVGHVYLWN
jgi:hypothetical protein